MYSKILFVCRENIGRSQVAMAYYNAVCPKQASSAGITVDKPHQKLSDNRYARNVIRVLAEDGIDIGSSRRYPLSSYDLDAFMKIIVLAERSVIPDWLLQLSNVEVVSMPDMKGRSLAFTRELCEEIREMVLAYSAEQSVTPQFFRSGQ